LSCAPLFAAGQIVVSHRVPAARRLAVFRGVTAGAIVPLLVYAGLACVWGEAWPRWAHWLLYAAAQVTFTGLCTIVLSLYWEIMTDNVPLRRRGLLYGLRTAAAGAAGLSMGYFATRVLAHWATPFNFRLSLLIGTAAFLASCIAMWHVRDHVNPQHAADADVRGKPLHIYLRETLRTLWSNPSYRIAIAFLILLAIATSGAPFMVAAAAGPPVHASAQAQGVFSLVYLGTTAALGLALGLLADRYGYRLVACVCSGLMGVAFLLCLTGPAIGYWYVAYGAYALAGMSIGMMVCNLSAEICPGVAPNRLVAVGNVLVMGIALPATTLSGAVVDWCGSYAPVFVAYLALSLAALCGFALVLRDPRRGRDLRLRSAR
jgi:hypothetical protein